MVLSRKSTNHKIKGDLDGLLSQYLISKRLDLLCPFLKGRRHLLDVGCGVFRMGALLSSDVEYVGIDSEPEIIKYNQRLFKYPFFLVNVETEDLRFLGKEFDLILMLAVIEHLKHPENVLKNLRPLLSEEGILLLTTPHPIGASLLRIGSRIAIFSRDKGQHQKLLNYYRMKRLADATGFKMIRYKRFLLGFNQLIVLKNKKYQTSTIDEF
jgi:2-polyprenyl-3-methyl-5-hydroxy-6-metoxy-1,4-benzoquinol methylase